MGPQAPIDALTLVAARLSDIGVAWMLTGSVAAFLYGRDRSTADIDIVVDCSNLTARRLVESLQPEYFLDEEMTRDGIVRKETFNAILCQADRGSISFLCAVIDSNRWPSVDVSRWTGTAPLFTSLARRIW